MSCDSTPNRLNIKFQLIPRCFAYGSPRVVFLRQKLNDPSTKKPKGTLKKTKITEGYDLVSKPSSDTN